MQINIYRVKGDMNEYRIDWESQLGCSVFAIAVSACSSCSSDSFTLDDYKKRLKKYNNDITCSELWFKIPISEYYRSSEYALITSININTAEEFLEELTLITTPGYLEKEYPEFFI